MTTIAEKSLINTNPIKESRFQKLEKALKNLFYQEMGSKDSIFINVNPLTIQKIALFMAKTISRPIAIGVCGETASGKSTIVLDTMEIIQSFAQEFMIENAITRINTDDYYYDKSKEVEKAGSFSEFVKNYDLDVPHAIELSLMKRHIKDLLQNKAVYLPKYDMTGSAKRFDKHKFAKPSPIIMSEGLFTLNEEVADVFDFKVYVDIEKEVQKRRFYERANQRGLGASANKIFKNASEKAEIYIKPCKQTADIIVNGEASRKRFKNFAASFLVIFEEFQYNLSLQNTGLKTHS